MAFERGRNTKTIGERLAPKTIKKFNGGWSMKFRGGAPPPPLSPLLPIRSKGLFTPPINSPNSCVVCGGVFITTSFHLGHNEFQSTELNCIHTYNSRDHSHMFHCFDSYF